MERAGTLLVLLPPATFSLRISPNFLLVSTVSSWNVVKWGSKVTN